MERFPLIPILHLRWRGGGGVEADGVTGLQAVEPSGSLLRAVEGGGGAVLGWMRTAGLGGEVTLSVSHDDGDDEQGMKRTLIGQHHTAHSTTPSSSYHHHIALHLSPSRRRPDLAHPSSPLSAVSPLCCAAAEALACTSARCRIQGHRHLPLCVRRTARIRRRSLSSPASYLFSSLPLLLLLSLCAAVRRG